MLSPPVGNRAEIPFVFIGGYYISSESKITQINNLPSSRRLNGKELYWLLGVPATQEEMPQHSSTWGRLSQL
jgi:hypothetical protein